MKIAIIETGLPPEPIRADWPRYPDMFRQLLSPEGPQLGFETVRLLEGDALPAASAFDGYLYTGSPAGVYEDHPWMQPLFEFIQAASAARVPQVGICFGHQAIAQAMGGEVIKSPKGWGIGRHVYDVMERPGFMNDAPHQFALAVSHQDQVVTPPPGAQTIARSDFCQHAALHDPAARYLTFQGHPEFQPDYSCALYNIRRGTKLPEAMVDAAEESLKLPLDSAMVARWMCRFYTGA